MFRLPRRTKNIQDQYCHHGYVVRVDRYTKNLVQTHEFKLLLKNQQLTRFQLRRGCLGKFRCGECDLEWENEYSLLEQRIHREDCPNCGQKNVKPFHEKVSKIYKHLRN